MKNYKVRLIVLLGIFIFGNEGKLQAQEEEIYKNSIYINMGSVIFSSQSSISYDRLLLQKNNFKTKGRLNAGHYLYNFADYDQGAKLENNYLSLSLIQMIGVLELGAGLAYSQFTLAPGFEPDSPIDSDELLYRVTYVANLGLRIEKNKFLFRFGIGNLELLYLGLGMNF